MPSRRLAAIAIPCLCLGLGLSEPAPHHGQIDVAVVMSQNLAPYRAAIEAFSAEDGVRVTVLDLKGDVEEGAWILRKIQTLDPDAILTVGSLATEIIGTRISDIPIVFCMTPKVAAEVSAAPNVTGVYLMVDPDLQFQALKELVPKVRTVGVIYDPAQSEKTIRQAAAAARSRDLTLQTRPIESPKDVPKTIREFIGTVDAIWMFPDPTCFNRDSFEFLLKQSIEHRVPIMVFAEAYVKAGALLSLSPDYGEIGRQAARLIARIHAGESASRILPKGPEKPVLVVNRRTAESLGIEMTGSALANAVIVGE